MAYCIATVAYQVATYSGEIEVPCNEDEEENFIVARAKRILASKSGGSLPFGYKSFRVTTITNRPGE